MTQNVEKTQTCEERVDEHRKNRIEDLRKLWDLYQKDPEAYDDELGNFNEYALAFDYVEPDTFENQKEGYYRYQISCGGPSEEFRFFVNVDKSVHRIEFWFLDWFDGSNQVLSGKDLELMTEIYNFLACIE